MMDHDPRPTNLIFWQQPRSDRSLPMVPELSSVDGYLGNVASDRRLQGSYRKERQILIEYCSNILSLQWR